MIGKESKFLTEWGRIKCQNYPPRRKISPTLPGPPKEKGIIASHFFIVIDWVGPHSLISSQERLFCMSENESFGRAFPLPKIFFCSSLFRLSSFFFIFCFSCSIFICSSIILSLSSAIFLCCSSIFFWFSSIIRSASSRRLISSSSLFLTSSATLCATSSSMRRLAASSIDFCSDSFWRFCLSISICRSTSVCFRLDEELVATPLSLSASEPDVVDASELEERCLRLRCLRPRWRSRSLRSLRLS